MTTLAELEAQQNALNLAFAQNDKAKIDAVVAALADPGIAALLALLATQRDGLSVANPARPRIDDLVNVLTMCPALFVIEASRLAALIDPPAAEMAAPPPAN
jgi:hypothetical protein